MFPTKRASKVYIISLVLVFCPESFPLRLTKAVKRTDGDCKEVLTSNPVVCRKVGSFPIAGACEHFARCSYEDDGLDWQVDFCPDGHIYVVNRCVKSDNKNDCPQKHCSTASQVPISEPTRRAPPITSITTTSKPIFPPALSSKGPIIEILRPPTSIKPILQTLHPGVNHATRTNFYQIDYLILLSAILALKTVWCYRLF